MTLGAGAPGVCCLMGVPMVGGIAVAVVVVVGVGFELKPLRGELWRYRETAASLLRQVHELESINRQLRGTVHELERKR